MRQIKKIIAKILDKPSWALLVCLVFLFLNLVADGTLFRVFRLNQDLRIVQNRIKYLNTKNQDLKNKIKKAADPSFVEKEVRQRLDYANEEDLIFIFPEKI